MSPPRVVVVGLADASELRNDFGLELSTPDREKYDLVVGAVAHADYRNLSDGDLAGMLRPGGTLADVRGMWRDRALDPSIDRWCASFCKAGSG
jgi:UDP-N-acetyl-D-galactosamine dehydrogenase